MEQGCILDITGHWQDRWATIQNGLSMMIKNLELLMIEKFIYTMDNLTIELITKVGIVLICYFMKVRILKMSFYENFI
jgi:hypothetical protein